MNQIKPMTKEEFIQQLIHSYFGKNPTNIESMDGGNINSVLSFEIDQQAYVLRFSDQNYAFSIFSYISMLLTEHGVLFPKVLKVGKAENLVYCLSEKIQGEVLANFEPKQQLALLPSLAGQLAKMTQIDLSATTGYGFLKATGAGIFNSWQEFIAYFFGENHNGTFWENWHGLFETSCLEREVFFKLYERLLKYSKYNAPHRYVVHGDFHPWNIIANPSEITGLIDVDNFMYGDFLIDIATISHELPPFDWQGQFEKLGIGIPDFEERLTGARYFKGLDSLRFYAKMGWVEAYYELRDKLLALPE